MHAHAHIHRAVHTLTRTQRIRIHLHINDTFKATKDIADGQELFIRYGGVEWFESKNIPFADVDYANTMWRPDLQPLPCRRKVDQTTGADGRHSYVVLEAIRPDSILEISLCLEVSLIVVDQFPYLWDFVITGEMGNEYFGCLLPTDLASSRARTTCVFCRSRRRKNWRAC